jgi:iron-sulfur cluster assembly accessory protein
MLIVTAAARAEIQALTTASQDMARSLRIQLLPGGCCGTYYGFSIDEQQHDDLVEEHQGIHIFLTSAAAVILDGAKLDYGSRLKPPRFRILHNPNTPVKCPCRRSFGMPYSGKHSPYCKAYEPMPWHQTHLVQGE